MISIYPSKLDGEAIQEFRLSASTTFVAWIHSTKSVLWKWLVSTDEISPGLPARLPVSIHLNGQLIDESLWSLQMLQPDDDVVVVFEAKGSVVSGLFNAVSSVVNSVFKIFIKTPSLPTATSYAQGNSIDKTNFKANQSKLNQPIREAFGRNRTYPDYAVQTHQRFEGNDQHSYMLLCVGVGHYQINPGEVFIGNTPISSFGSDAHLQIFGPGEDVSSNSAAQNWYNAPEVGNTSSGRGGLKLTESFTVTPVPDVSTYSLGPAPESSGGGTVSIPNGAGSFPDGWSSGMELSIMAAQLVQFGTGALPDGISGQGQTTGDYYLGPVDHLDFDLNDHIQLKGDIEAAIKCIGKAVVNDQTRYYLGDYDKNVITWIGSGTKNVMVTTPSVRYRITDTDASGTYDPNENDDDSSTIEDDYRPPQSLTVQRIHSSGTIDKDWQGFDPRSSSDYSIRLTSDTSDGGWLGPFNACPENETTTTIEYDLMFPQGLLLLNEKGKQRDVILNWDVQYRDVHAGGAWTTVSDSYRAGTNDELAITRVISIPNHICPEVRIRRAGVDYPGDTEGTTYSECDWSGLRSWLASPSKYDDVTTLALKIRTGERLAAQSENKVWCYATRMLSPYNAPGSNLAATRDIAPAMMYIARQRGYGPDDVDMNELGRLHSIWQSRGDFFDMEFSDETSVKDAINNALGAGYAEITNDHGLLRPWRDERRTNFDHMYSPQNLTSELKVSFSSANKASSDTFDGLTVEFNNIATGQKETVDCLLPRDSGEKMDTRTVYGITDRVRAWRWGMRERAKQVYRDMNFEAQTGFDALNSAYGDYVQLSGDYSDYSQSGVIYGYTEANGEMTLSTGQSLEWAEGQQHVITLRGQDGAADGPYAANRGDNDDEVIINTPSVIPNMDPTRDLTHFVFGVDSRSSWGALVQSVSPSGSPVGDQEPQVTLQAEIYDERVYNFDDAQPPAA